MRFAVATELTAIDRMSARLRGIGRAFGGLGGAVSRLNRGFGGLARAATSFAAPLVVLGGLGSFAGIGHLASSTADFGDALAKTADRLGFTVEGLQEYRFAAERTGVTTQNFDIAMQRLTRRMADAAGGKNKQVAGLFKSLGVSLTDAAGNVRSASDVLPELADGFSKVENPAMRVKAAFALFDTEGVKLATTLGEGRDALEAYAKEARKYGVMSEKQARQAEKFKKSQFNLGQVFKGLKFAIGENLLPVLTEVMDRLTAFLAANKGDIAKNLNAAFKTMGDELRALDFKKISDGITKAFAMVSDAVDAVGGIKNAILAVVGVISLPLLSAVGNIGLGFAQMGFKVLPIIGGLAKGLIALTFNPVTLTIIAAIAAIAALALAVKVVIHNWTALGNFFSNLWGDIERMFEKGVLFILERVATVANALPDFLRDEIPGIEAFDKAVSDLRKSASGPPVRLPVEFSLPTIADIKGDIDSAVDELGSLISGPDTKTPPAAAAAAAAAAGGGPPGVDPAANPGHGIPGGRARVEIVFKNAPTGTRVDAVESDRDTEVETKLDIGPGLAGATL